MTTKEFRTRGIEIRGAKNKKPRKTEERNHQTALFTILDLSINRRRYPFLKFVYASLEGAYKLPHIAALEKRSGMRKGVLDICLPFSRHGYGGGYLEMKFGDNSTSPEQKEFIAHLTAENFCVKTVYSVDAAIEFIEWFLKISLVK